MENLQTVEAAKERLDEWLRQGIIVPGGKLPSERELSEMLGLKRMTLRQALLNLEGESKVFRKDRRGWFAAQPRFNFNPKSSTSFKQAALDQGRFPSWGYFEKKLVHDAPDAIVTLLNGTPEQGLYCISGWGALDNHKVFYHETFINPAEADNFIDELDERSFAEVWDKTYNRKIITSHLAFRPTRLSVAASKVIGGNTSTPAILVEKRRADNQRNILQIDIEYWRFESVDFYIDL